jgi:protein-tyrosine phosphatase
MIDIHTHILPHLDDGAKNTQMSVAMLNMLQEQGVKAVVLTPHYYGKRSSPEEFVKRRNSMFEHIKAQIPKGLEVRLGAELHFTGINMPEYDELCRLAIEGTKYILVEFPFTTKWTGELLQKLNHFISETGYTPIIAHAERYREIQKKPALVSQLMEMGCLIQVNVHSFLDKREGKIAFALLKHGFVHCLGTDSHDMEGRSPDFTAAKAEVERRGLLDEWTRAEGTMEDVLANKQVSIEWCAPIKKVLWMYR